MINIDNVRDALRHVDDPDLKKDLVSLGMIEEITVEGNTVRFNIVLTTPACPLKDMIKNDCIAAIHQYVSPDLEVIPNMTSRVRVAQRNVDMLRNVKNIIAVSSGKGGVGKSTIAANLAVALAKTGAKTGLLDADIYGPSVPLMFGLSNAHPQMITREGKNLVVPVEKFDVKILSIGFFVEPEKALVWRGPMASGALTQLFSETDWGDLDYLVIDMPPGTGDIHLTLVQQLPVTGVVVVTTPQEVALADARKALDFYNQEKINVPVLGLVENMSWFTPAELPNNKYYIFGKEGGVKFAESTGVPLLGQIPLVESICESGDQGNPVANDEKTPTGKAFTSLAAAVAQQVAIRNAQLPPTEVVKMQE
ncbi:MAG: Mrp/NBP35 family ATP-binding protein [Bacteroidales bacterium]|nr:Mrp/NBP35 family ATP-binding protein [Bacteroidales bacterium]